MSFTDGSPVDYETGDFDGVGAALSTRQARDVAGAALVAAGLLGLVALGFAVDWRLGVAGACLVLVLAGLLLGRA